MAGHSEVRERQNDQYAPAQSTAETKQSSKPQSSDFLQLLRLLDQLPGQPQQGVHLQHHMHISGEWTFICQQGLLWTCLFTWNVSMPFSFFVSNNVLSQLSGKSWIWFWSWDRKGSSRLETHSSRGWPQKAFFQGDQKAGCDQWTLSHREIPRIYAESAGLCVSETPDRDGPDAPGICGQIISKSWWSSRPARKV